MVTGKTVIAIIVNTITIAIGTMNTSNGDIPPNSGRGCAMPSALPKPTSSPSGSPNGSTIEATSRRSRVNSVMVSFASPVQPGRDLLGGRGPELLGNTVPAGQRDEHVLERGLTESGRDGHRTGGVDAGADRVQHIPLTADDQLLALGGHLVDLG